MKRIIILFFFIILYFNINADVSKIERLEKYKQAAIFLNDVYKIKSISEDKIENIKDVEDLKIIGDSLKGFVEIIDDWDKIDDSKKISEAILKIANKGNRKKDNAKAYNDLKDNLSEIDKQVSSKDSVDGNRKDEVVKSDNSAADYKVVSNESKANTNIFKYINLFLLVLLSIISIYSFLQYKKIKDHIKKINNNILQLSESIKKMETKSTIKNEETKQVVLAVKEPIVETKVEIDIKKDELMPQILEPQKTIVKYAKKSSNGGFENRDLRVAQNGECLFELHILDSVAKLKISNEPQVLAYVLKSDNPGYYFTNDICDIKGTPNADNKIKLEEEGQLQLNQDGTKWDISNNKKVKIAFQ